ncbi:hypothetical protein RFE14_004253, partial [Klebsiella pneumoniae]|nr:hypothetical protein [Klebsiella pneumoniae]
CTYPDPALRTDEIIVFFEAEDRVRASKKIVRLLADLWGCRESFVEVWNLEDEHELVLSSVNVSVPRYWMMLEIGSGPSGPVYVDVKRDGYPLLLVSPRKLQQLYQALGEVPHE